MQSERTRAIMPIDWFSPLLPAPTDIANYTARLLPELVQRAEVTLWSEAETIERRAPVRRYRDLADIPRSSGVKVLHLGNDRRFHEQIYRICRTHPAIIVLHETDLGDMMKMIARHDIDIRREWRTRRREPDWLGRLPLERALGLFVHSRSAAEHAQKRLRCPVGFHPLPYPPGNWTHHSRVHDQPLRLIIFGYLGRNRQLDVALKAISSYPRKDQLRLDIFGPIEHEKTIVRLIARLRLADRVTLHGPVSEQRLDEALERADLAINLRYPTMGEGSGSQLRIWDHAMPSIVTRIGAYAEFPPGTVAYADVGNEIEDMHAHFDRAFADPEFLRAIGARGRETLLQNHSCAAYLDALFGLIAACPAQ